MCAILACGLAPWDYDRSEGWSVPYCALCPGPSCPLLRLAKTPWVTRGSFLCWRQEGGAAGGHYNLRRGARAEGGSLVGGGLQSLTGPSTRGQVPRFPAAGSGCVGWGQPLPPAPQVPVRALSPWPCLPLARLGFLLPLALILQQHRVLSCRCSRKNCSHTH